MRSIPVSRSRTITRPHLLKMLETRPHLRVINVVAPAGYGKTTFVAEWAQSLTSSSTDRRDPAWLTLFDDAAPEQLLRDILKSLLPFLPSLQSILTLDGGAENSLTQRTRMLCAEIAAASRPIVLIFDDYHLLTRPESLALIQQILDFAPDDLLLVLVSRTLPALQVNALILDDAVLTFTERDLAFDHDDFAALVTLFGLESLPPTVLDDLEQRCAGWITGIKLLAYDLRLTRSTISRAFPAASSDGALNQFIASRVLASMPAHLQEFAFAAAPLPWMSADLMAAVTGASPTDCARTIHELIAANTFVAEFIGADSEPLFRFHPLIHDALRRAAAARHQAPPERRRAAAWFLAHDDVDTALTILGADLSLQESADEITHAIRRVLLRSELVAAQRWLNALPTTLLDAHAPLAVLAGWTGLLTESILDLEEAIPRAQAALANHIGEHDELHLDVMVQSTYLNIMYSRTDDAVRALAAAEALAQPMDTLGYGYLHLIRAIVPSNLSDLEMRVRMLQIAADLFERIGHDHGVLTALYCQIVLKFRYADLHGALASAEFMQGFCERHHLERHNHARETLSVRGWLLYLLNHIPQAREVLQHTIDIPVYDNLQEGTCYFSSIYLQLCDAAEADDPVATLSATDEIADAARWVRALEMDLRSSLGLIAWPHILRNYRAGHPERCRQTIESMHLAPADLSDQTEDTIRVAVLAGAVLGNQNTPQLDAHLDACLAHLETDHAVYMAMQVRVLSVLHFLQRGDKREALTRLRALLPFIERSEATRMLLDFPTLRELLQACDTPFARDLLSHFPASSTDFGLTAQETRILTYLADGQTTKEIAVIHTISHRTIYAHVHNIFKKLGVHNRDEAVQVWTKSRNADRI